MQGTLQPVLESDPIPLKCKEIVSAKPGTSRAGRWAHWQTRREASEQQQSHRWEWKGWLPVSRSTERNTHHLGLIYGYPTHFRKCCLSFQYINFFARRIIFNRVCRQMPRMILLPTEHSAPVCTRGRMRTQRQAPATSALSQATCSLLFCLIHSLLPCPQSLHLKCFPCFYRKNFP